MRRERSCERVTAVIEQLTSVAPKVAELLADAEQDLLAFSTTPGRALEQARSTNLLERVNREIVRRSDVVRIRPDDASLIRLAGVLLIEQRRMACRAPLPVPGIRHRSRPPTNGNLLERSPRTGAVRTQSGKETAKEASALAA
jgi:hypothetical protein